MYIIVYQPATIPTYKAVVAVCELQDITRHQGGVGSGFTYFTFPISFGCFGDEKISQRAVPANFNPLLWYIYTVTYTHIYII